MSIKVHDPLAGYIWIGLKDFNINDIKLTVSDEFARLIRDDYLELKYMINNFNHKNYRTYKRNCAKNSLMLQEEIKEQISDIERIMLDSHNSIIVLINNNEYELINYKFIVEKEKDEEELKTKYFIKMFSKI